MKNILAIQSHVVYGHAGNSAAEFPMCNFAFFSGLIDAQFRAGSAQPKSPELTANYH
ncbi:hypothetical protein EsCd1KSP079_02066 [Escherichia sp. KS167_9B]|nr:hypothetical protein EsCd1KSP079_02066 [Escherichia sp. KS167_9B]